MIKIHEKSILVAIKMETRKKNAKKHRKITENVENGPQNEPRRGHFLVIWLLFSVPDGFGPPRAPKASPSLDFYRFLVDFGWFFDDFLYHVSYFLSGLLHYFFGYLEVSFSNFWPQVQMCWGRTQGSARWQKSAKTSKASLRKRFSRHGGGTAGGNWLMALICQFMELISWWISFYGYLILFYVSAIHGILG